MGAPRSAQQTEVSGPLRHVRVAIHKLDESVVREIHGPQFKARTVIAVGLRGATGRRRAKNYPVPVNDREAAEAAEDSESPQSVRTGRDAIYDDLLDGIVRRRLRRQVSRKTGRKNDCSRGYVQKSYSIRHSSVSPFP